MIEAILETLLKDKILVVIPLVITCMSIGYRMRDEEGLQSWGTRGLIILMLVLLLVLAS